MDILLDLSLVAVVFLAVGRKESKIQVNSNLERHLSREDLEFPMDPSPLIPVILEIGRKMVAQIILDIGGKAWERQVGLSLVGRVK